MRTLFSLRAARTICRRPHRSVATAVCLLGQAWLGATGLFGQGALTPPGAPAPTMKRLDEVEARVIVNTTNTPASGNYAYRIVPGVDSDGDCIADAYEYQYFGNLTTANATISYLHDSTTDLQRYLAGVSPTDANAFPRITLFSATANGTGVSLTFTSSPARLYTLETTTDLANGAWSDSGPGTFAPAGSTTTLTLGRDAVVRRFYRVRPQRPLP